MSNKRGLEDFMTIVEESHSKTASTKTEKFNPSLITKLAEELTKSAGDVAEATADVKPAASSVAGANTDILSATEAATANRLVLAGANPAEVAKGETPAPTKPNEGVIITDTAGKVTDANAISKDPAAVVAAAGVEKTAELQRAEEIGAVMAQSYVKELEKIAYDRQYTEALEFLNSRSALEGYNIKS